MKFSSLKIYQIIREKEKKEKRRRMITWGEGAIWTIVAIVLISQGIRMFGPEKLWSEPVTAYAYTFFHPQEQVGEVYVDLDSLRNILDTLVKSEPEEIEFEDPEPEFLADAYTRPAEDEWEIEEKPIEKPRKIRNRVSKGTLRGETRSESKEEENHSEVEPKEENGLPQPESINGHEANALFGGTMPSYKGGTTALNQFIKNKLEYPLNARQNSVEGKVMLKLWIEIDGKISRIGIMQGLGYGCDEEAVRIARAMDGWIPGEKDGAKRAMWTYVPIIFSLAREN